MNGKRAHILFLDDEVSLANLGKTILERLDYVVTAHTDPLEAIAAVRADPAAYDLVITDLNMPGMNGVELALELIEIQPRLPMILTTGYGGALTEEEMQEAGFRALLLKPNTVETLAETVHRVLHGA